MHKNTLGLLVVAALCAIGGSGSICWGSEKARETKELYEVLERFHGHVCGGSLMGARLGLAARAALEQSGSKGKFKARYFSLACPADGIQVAAGTTYGNRAIEVEDRDEQRLLLSDEKSGREVEVRLTTTAAEKAGASRDLTKKAKSLPADSPERVRLEREVEGIFTWLRTAPEAAVVTVRFVR